MQQQETVQLEGTTIHICGTTHGANRNLMMRGEKNKQKVNELQSELQRFRPQVIYVELDPHNVTQELENSRAKDGAPEIVAVSNYMENKTVQVVGVDSEHLKKMGRNFNNQDVTDMSRGLRDDAMALAILGHVSNHSPDTAVFLVGYNHVEHVKKNIEQYNSV